VAGVSTEPAEPHDPQRCTPCRGTGQVVSTLGGTPQLVTCPWCEGGGRFLPGHDAQAARRSASASE
jgi:DnaJ-class molecular chaperone